MRDFFINSFEKLVSVIVILMILGVVIFSVMIMFGGGGMMPAPYNAMGGFVPGLIFLVAGLVYVIFVGGFMYLGLGIYQNTKATAEAVKDIAGRG